MASWPRARRSGRRRIAEVFAVAAAAIACGACTLLAPSDATYTSDFGKDATSDDARPNEGGPSLDSGCSVWCQPPTRASLVSWTFSPGSQPAFDAGTIVTSGHCGAALQTDGLTVQESQIFGPEVWVAFTLVDLPEARDGLYVALGDDKANNVGLDVRVGDAGVKLETHPNTDGQVKWTKPVRIVLHAVNDAGITADFYDEATCNQTATRLTSDAGFWGSGTLLVGDKKPVVIDDLWISTAGPPTP
jgi:hypothetical protein